MCPMFSASFGYRRVRWKPGEDYKPQCLSPTVKFSRGSVMSWWCLSKDGIWQIGLFERTHESSHVQGYPARKLALTMYPNFYPTVFHTTQPGQSRCGWRTTGSRLCHGQPNLQNHRKPIENLWKVMKMKMDGHKSSNIDKTVWIFFRLGRAKIHPRATWKAGGEHAKTQKSCD